MKDTISDWCAELFNDLVDKIRQWQNIIDEWCGAVTFCPLSSKIEFRAEKKLLRGQKQSNRIQPAIPKKRNKFRYTSGFL